MWSLWLCVFHHLRQNFFMDFGKTTIMVLLFSPVTFYCFSTWTTCKDHYCSYFPLKVPVKAHWLLRECSQFQSNLVLTPCSRRVRYETNSVQGNSGTSSWGVGRLVGIIMINRLWLSSKLREIQHVWTVLLCKCIYFFSIYTIHPAPPTKFIRSGGSLRWWHVTYQRSEPLQRIN